MKAKLGESPLFHTFMNSSHTRWHEGADASSFSPPRQFANMEAQLTFLPLRNRVGELSTRLLIDATDDIL